MGRYFSWHLCDLDSHINCYSQNDYSVGTHNDYIETKSYTYEELLNYIETLLKLARIANPQHINSILGAIVVYSKMLRELGPNNEDYKIHIRYE
jgi:hypothetical protein